MHIINETVGRYLNFLKLYHAYSEITLQQHRTRLRRFEERLQTKKNSQIIYIEDITTQDVYDFIERLRTAKIAPYKQPRNCKSLDHNTISFYAASIRLLLKRCLTIDIPCLSWYKVPVIKQHVKQAPYVTKKEAHRFIHDAAAEGRTPEIRARNSLLFQFAFLCGLRRTEILNLTFSQVLGEDDQISIPTKFHRNRVFYVSPELKQEVQEYRDMLYKKKGLFAKLWDEDHIFTSMNGANQGKKMTRYAAMYAIKQVRARLKFDRKVTLHSFRHGHATELLRQGRSETEVSKSLGHSDYTSFKRYIHMDKEWLIAVQKSLYA